MKEKIDPIVLVHKKKEGTPHKLDRNLPNPSEVKTSSKFHFSMINKLDQGVYSAPF